MKKIYYALMVLACISLSGCARTCNSLDRSFQTGSRNYHIEQYSGGQKINVYDFRGILDNQEGSDGFYFYKGDTLIEVSGTLLIKSTK